MIVQAGRRRNRSLAQALAVALSGMAYALRTQPNMRLHLGAAMCVLTAALVLRFDAVRLAVVVLTIGAVVGAEWFNTAVEHLVDLATQEAHSLARLAKDLAAGGVLWCGVVALVIGCLLFIPALPQLPAAVAALSAAQRGLAAGALAAGIGLIAAGLIRR